MNQPLSFPSDAIIIAPLDTTESLTFSIGVQRPANPDGLTLDQYVQGIDAGTHPTLDKSTFINHFGAFKSDMWTVSSWAESNGLTLISSNCQTALVQLTGTVQQINTIFGITLSTVTTPDRTYRTYEGTLNVPDNVASVITYIFGLTEPVKPTRIQSAVTPDLLAGTVPLLPTQVAAAYNFPENTGAGTCIALVEFDGGYTTQNVETSFVESGLPVPTVISPPTNTAQSFSDVGSNAEVMLDIFVAGGSAPGATIAVYFINDWIDILTYIIDDNTNNPSVISTSWTTREWNVEYSSVVTSPSQYPSSYIATIDAQVFLVAKALGITIIAASGDTGSENANPGGPAEAVNWPASSPYVLGVGGTSLTVGASNTITNEIAWYQSGNSSGGGLSAAYSVPTWQSGLTYSAYNSITHTTSGPFPLTTRGVPDVAANADPNSGYQYYYYNGASQQNATTIAGGTSAAAPLWAGLVARINASIGYNIGFVNPFFYENTQFFNSITVGNNAAPLAGGYAATAGWDAVTGLGTPDGQAIMFALSPPTTENTTATVNFNSSNNVLPLSITNTYSSIGISSEPIHGQASISGVNILYTPNTGYYGADSLSYIADNINGISNPPGIVSITVYLPDLPVAVNSTATINYGSANDGIGLEATNYPTHFTVVAGPYNGTVTNVSSNVVYYTPIPNYYGTDSFEFQASNVNGLSNVGTITIDIPAPIIEFTVTPGITTLVENQEMTPLTFAPSGGTGPYTGSITGLPTGLRFTQEPDNTFTLSGKPASIGTYTFTVTIFDSSIPTPASTSATYTVNVLIGTMYWINNSLPTTLLGNGYYNDTLVTSDPNTSFSVIAGSLPPGLTLSSSGVFSGTVTESVYPTTYKFTVRANGLTLSKIIDQTYTMVFIGQPQINWPTVALSTSGFFVDQDFVSIQLAASSEIQPVTYYATSILPNNLQLSSSGLLSGILNLDAPLNTVTNVSFTVGATNGYSTSTTTFTLSVINANTTSSYYESEITTGTTIPIVQAPEFLNGTDLGTVSDNSNQYLIVGAYDPYPWEGPVTYSTNVSVLGLTFNPYAGILSGNIPPQANYKQTYNIPVTATKVDTSAGITTSSINTFTLTVIQSNSDVMTWVSTASLGTILMGADSQLSVTAKNLQTQYPLVYSVVSAGGNQFAGGLTLMPSGNIVGNATTSGTYTFTVVASTGTVYTPSSWANTVTTGIYCTPVSTAMTFTLVVEGTEFQYTNIYLKSFYTGPQREFFDSFINNSNVFVTDLIYRPDDPNFGVQTDPRFYLTYGIQKLNSGTDYVSALEQNFYPQIGILSESNVITALDSDGNAIYDAVYIEVIDQFSPNQSVEFAFSATNIVEYHPASFANMRANLANLNSGTISINQNLVPLWQQTSINSGAGFINGVVLCYTLPGQGYTIVNNIDTAYYALTTGGFNQLLTVIIDRIVIESTLSTEPYSNKEAYVIFPNRTI
jgi:kumamolisin